MHVERARLGFREMAAVSPASPRSVQTLRKTRRSISPRCDPPAWLSYSGLLVSLFSQFTLRGSPARIKDRTAPKQAVQDQPQERDSDQWYEHVDGLKGSGRTSPAPCPNPSVDVIISARKHHDAGNNKADPAAGQDRRHRRRQNHLEQYLHSAAFPPPWPTRSASALQPMRRSRWTSRMGKRASAATSVIFDPVAEAEQKQQRRIKCDFRQRRQHAHDWPNHGIDRWIGGRGDANTLRRARPQSQKPANSRISVAAISC